MLSRWHEDLAAHDEAFACLQDLLDPSSFATTVVKAFREWGQGLLGCESRMAVMSAAWFVEFRQRLPWLLHVD